jgi:transposase
MVATSLRGAEHALENLDHGVSCQPLDDGRCAMAVLFTSGAGWDGPKNTVMAGRGTPDPTGQQADGRMARQVCGPMTVDLLALSEWLAAAGITPVAMDSTGEDWKPLSTMWAGECTGCLVTAAPVTQGPGRKTDQADARWVAKRRRDGWLPARFIPPLEPRDWRDLTRYRTKLGQERRREVHRGPGVLARATSKLAAVAPDSMGVAARAILAALVEGRADPAPMAEVATRRMRRKMPRLEQALTGLGRDHHRQWLARPWAPSDCLDEPIEALSAEMRRRRAALSGDAPPSVPPGPTGEAGNGATPESASMPMPCARAGTLLDTIPGVNQRGGERLGAEWGIDLGRLGTAARLAAWSGVAPGHEESAGQQHSGKTRQGHQARRPGLTQWAHAAARTKGTDLSALSQRLAARRGKTRAIIAVAHSIVVRAFHLLSRHAPYRE